MLSFIKIKWVMGALMMITKPKNPEVICWGNICNWDYWKIWNSSQRHEFFIPYSFRLRGSDYLESQDFNLAKEFGRKKKKSALLKRKSTFHLQALSCSKITVNVLGQLYRKFQCLCFGGSRFSWKILELYSTVANL